MQGVVVLAVVVVVVVVVLAGEGFPMQLGAGALRSAASRIRTRGERWLAHKRAPTSATTRAKGELRCTAGQRTRSFES